MVSEDRDGLRIALVDSAEDLEQAFECTAAAFGRQTKDGIWMTMNPGWDTPEGRQQCVQRLTERWKTATKDKNERLNTIYLKASLMDTQLGSDRVVGLAIWQQASLIDGYGDAPPDDGRRQKNAAATYPSSESERRYLFQLESSIHRRRRELVREKATADQPAVMVLDLCVVDPNFQGRGIATKLVQWGLEEAERRGGLEAVTEASMMGRKVYSKLGFEQEGDEIEYVVDAEFANRERPSNIFMRTRPMGQ